MTREILTSIKSDGIYQMAAFKPVTDLGGGLGGGLLPPQELDALPSQRVPPWYYFDISIFREVPLKFSKGAFGANLCQFLRGERAPKKRDFFGHSLPKTA